MINAMINTDITVKRTFNIPILGMSPIASLTDKAAPKLSYLANLHIAMN